jgi:hypothetical protein
MVGVVDPVGRLGRSHAVEIIRQAASVDASVFSKVGAPILDAVGWPREVTRPRHPQIRTCRFPHPAGIVPRRALRSSHLRQHRVTS